MATSTFVGRELELSALDDALDVTATRGALFLIAGEPGIGKSRLADEFSEVARRRGARVLWGRCWEAGGAPAYWPWVQALRSYVREIDAEELRIDLGVGAPDVAQMIPEIKERLPELTLPPAQDPDAARFRLFDSTATFLRNAASRAPMTIVLEDIHAADTPSLLLLRFLAGELSRSKLLVIATYRDTHATEDPLATTLLELGREPITRRIELGGFDKSEVSQFIEATTERSPSDDLVLAVHHETEGNPLFVAEVVRLLAAEGRLDRPMGPVRRLGIPEGVRGVIGRRIGHLSFDCNRILGLASILGHEFSLDALERIAELPGAELVEILDEAIAARVVTEVPGALRRIRFSHALFRETLYDGLPPAHRMRLHKLAGEALEALSARNPESHLAELAHHFFEAAGSGDAAKALDYARRAGARAATLIAFEEADRLYAMALQALEFERPDDEAARCELLLARGDAQARAGEMSEAKATILQAVDISRRLRMHDSLAAAALAYGGRFTWVRAGNDPHLIPLLEDALEALGGLDHPLRVRLLARLSCALRDSRDRQRCDDLSATAVDLAERVGDPATLAYALNGRFAAIWWPENPKQRLNIAARFFALTLVDKELLFQGYQLRTGCHFELGDLASVRKDMDSARKLAEDLRQPSQLWLSTAQESLLALIEGRFDDAGREIEESLRRGGRAQDDATSTYRAHLYFLRREQGRSHEAEEAVRSAIEDFPWYPVHRCMLARLLLETGRRDDGARLYEKLSADGCAALPLDNEWLLGVALLAEICGHLDDEVRARELYDLLLPYADRNAHGHLEGSIGSVARFLGILATVLSRFDDAENHFADALEHNRRMLARPFVAWTLFDLASMLLRRGAAGDRERAASHVEEARTIAQTVGMVLLGIRLETLERSVGIKPPEAVPSPSVSPAENLFVREGEYWSVVYEGAPIRIRDSKGLRYIAKLLAAPGREFHVLDLMGVPGVGGGSATDDSLPAGGLGDAGEILDPEAKAAYRSRLAELDEAIEEARSWSDDERAARATEEREALLRELAGAVGLGGRDRKAASASERARVNVTRAIKSALARISEQTTALGKHLDATLRTGTFCSYTPDPRSSPVWKT